MVYSANPEDYTNRGAIITPLKDRIDSQVITHYPADISSAVAITAQEAWTERGGVRLHLPDWYRELVEQVAFAARSSEYVNQASGVSARMSIALLENVLSNMERRAILNGEAEAFPRITDLHTAVTAVTGKIELVYEGEQQGADIVARKIIGEAVKQTFRARFPDPSPPRKKRRRQAEEAEGEEDIPPARPEKQPPSPYQPVLSWFSKGNTLACSDRAPQAGHVRGLEGVDGLAAIAERHLPVSGTAAPVPAQAGADGLRDARACVMELVLEGLHQHSMISKREEGGTTSYRDMLKAMFERMPPGDAE
jgi:magnesium chelatase subunit I